MNHYRRVGILGGMGPAATADFYTKLIKATPASVDQEHLPVVIWADPTVPNRNAALLRGGRDPGPMLVDGARRLVAAGAELIAVPCNTAHAFLDVVREGVPDVPVLDMVSETAREIAALVPGSRVGLLATDGALASGLYQSALARLGLTPVWPGPSAQRGVMSAIQTVKSDTVDQEARAAVALAFDELRGAGVAGVIVGCTEVPLLMPREPAIPVVDAGEVLAAAVVREASRKSPR